MYVRTYVYVYVLLVRRAPARGAGPGTGPGPCSGAGRKALQGRRRGGRVGVPREGRAAGRAAGGHGSRREAGPKARPGDALRCGPGTGPCALRCASPTTAPNTVPRPTPRTGPHHTLFPFGPNRKGILTTKADEPPVLPRRWPENRPFSDVGGRQTARAPTEVASEPPVLRRRWLQKPAFFKDAKGVHCDLYCSMMRFPSTSYGERPCSTLREKVRT